MNIEKFKSFCKVVEYDSFSKASEELFCSQPAISKQIKSLEKAVGFPLFDRDGKKIRLNSNGKIVYKYSQRILDEISEMNRELIENNNSLCPVISFGATNFIGVHILTANLSKFKETYPDVSLSFTIDFIPNILKMLHFNKFSFAFIAETNLVNDYPDIKTEFFRDDELILVVPHNHVWSTKKSITLDELNTETFLVSQPNSAIRNFIEKKLYTKGVILKNTSNLYNIEGIKQSILNGHGISILPRQSVITELKHRLLVEVPINNLTFTRKLFIAYKKNKHFTSIERKFIQLI